MAHQNSFPAHMSAIEQEIANRIITSALDADMSISVFNGKEVTLRKSTDREAIQRETAACGETLYLFYRADGSRLGNVWLVHGNDHDMISDYYADLEELDALLEPAISYADGEA